MSAISGTIGAVVGSGAQKKAAKTAADAAQQSAQSQADVWRYMYDQDAARMAPYNQAGIAGLSQLLGYPAQFQAPGGAWGQPGDPMPTAPTMPTLPQMPQQDPYGIYAGLQASGFGGAGGGADPQYAHDMRQYEQQMQQYQNELDSYQKAMERGPAPPPAPEYAGGGVDPTGGAGQYLQQLEGMPALSLPELNMPQFQYQFDENDPGYQFRLSEMQKAIDQAAAARGIYNSRPTMQTHAQGSLALTADETQRQFGRQLDAYDRQAQAALSQYSADYGRSADLYDTQYGKLSDLYQMSGALGMTEYNKILDLVKIGQGAAAATGASGLGAAQGISQAYGQAGMAKYGAAMATGQVQGDLWSGLGAQPLNAYMMYQAMRPQGGSNYSAPAYPIGGGGGGGYIPGAWG